MIGVVEVISGYAAKLERLKKPVEFKPGLNICFGENGCGKSSLLKIIAAHCAIDCSNGNNGGWSKLMNPSFKSRKLPDAFSEFSPGKCKAKLEWDGTPTLLADTSNDQTDFSYFFYDKKDSPDGLTSMNDQLGVMFGHPSSGLLRMARLKKYYDALLKPPDITKVPEKFKNYNSVWLKSYQKLPDYVAGLSREGPISFLVDEPERSFSIENQMLFWKNFIPRVKNFQVIIATHSVFALNVEANWIEFSPGYLDKSREALKALRM